jgi:coniferyl-aldehyde dehydrogenase
VNDRAVSNIVFGKLLSGGQTCIAPDYALVHESEIDTFIGSYDRIVRAAYPDGPTSIDYTSIVNDQQYAQLKGLLDDARAHGARIIEVGNKPDGASRRPHTLAPTVVLGDGRDAHRPRGDLRPGPAGLPVPGFRGRDRLRECAAEAAGALLLRTG